MIVKKQKWAQQLVKSAFVLCSVLWWLGPQGVCAKMSIISKQSFMHKMLTLGKNFHIWCALPHWIIQMTDSLIWEHMPYCYNISYYNSMIIIDINDRTSSLSFHVSCYSCWLGLKPIKRECPGRPREITKMWHMLEKLISLIFCSEIPHDDLINVVYSFCSDLLLFSKKIGKMVHDANRYNMVDIKGPSINTRTLLLKSAKASSLFFFLCICMGGIGKSFKPKTRNFHLNLNSQRVFKNHQYFVVSKSNFGAFFQDQFFLCGITPNHLRFKLWLVEMFFFSKI